VDTTHSSVWRRLASAGIAILLGVFAAIDYRGASTAAAASPAPATATAGGVDLAAIEMGGRIESATSEWNNTGWAAWAILTGKTYADTGWSSADVHLPKDFPQEVVISFFGPHSLGQGH